MTSGERPALYALSSSLHDSFTSLNFIIMTRWELRDTISQTEEMHTSYFVMTNKKTGKQIAVCLVLIGDNYSYDFLGRCKETHLLNQITKEQFDIWR